MTIRFLRRRLIYIVALLLLAYALRVFRIDNQSIWWDEGISLHLATSSAAEIARDRLNNIHPPLYFFILKLWVSLVGASPFAGRYLSALAALGQVAVVFVLAQRWRRGEGGFLVPWLAAGLMAVSPLSVIYGQEIRVYAMLPLAYLGLLTLVERLHASQKQTWGSLATIAIIEWIALHLHYIALFGVAYVAVWGLLSRIIERNWRDARQWFVVQSIVALASLPWLVAVLSNWAAVSGEANAGTYLTEPVPLSYLFAQVWAFHLTGLAGSLASQFVRIAAAVTGFLVVVLIALRAFETRPFMVSRPSRVIRAATHWLVPLISALVVWNVRSFSHPRYIIMFAGAFIPLAAMLAAPAGRRMVRVLGAGLLTSLVVLSLWGLNTYFFDAESAKPDVRGSATFLEAVAGSDDLIVIPETDWSLPFEYNGATRVIMPGFGDATSALLETLDCAGDEACIGPDRVFVLDYPEGTRDWQGRLPFEMERRGAWIGEETFDGVRVHEYQMTSSGEPVETCERPADFSPLQFGALLVESVWIEQDAEADSAVAVAVCWRVVESTVDRLAITMGLTDPVTGERFAQAGSTLLNASGAPTEHWTQGEQVITYHLLPLPTGTPPIAADLFMGLLVDKETEQSPLEAVDTSGNPVGPLPRMGEARIGRSIGRDYSLYEVPELAVWEMPEMLAKGLELLEASFAPGPYRPGQTVRVKLTWRAAATNLPDIRPQVRLRQNDLTLAESGDAPVNGRHPTDRWHKGEIITEYRDLRLPPGSDGTAGLSVSVDERHIDLGQVTISGSSLIFDRPDVAVLADVEFAEGIRLVGFDPPPGVVTSAEQVPVTLYWQSSTGEIDTSYVVFVHLLAEDGRLIAQHDSPPSNGERPMHEWLAGEYIVDSHALTWRETSTQGTAQIAVGIYDPSTGIRLATADGSDNFLLPLSLIVENPE
jgi:hypothetical protein